MWSENDPLLFKLAALRDDYVRHKMDEGHDNLTNRSTTTLPNF